MKRVLAKAIRIIPLALLAAAIAYAFIPQPVPVDLVKPVRGSLQITVNDDGETRIREKYIVSAPVTGKLLRVQLDPGDPVERGKTELAQIKPSDPTLLDVRTKAEAQARVRTAEAEILQASAAVQRAEETLKLAVHDNERAKKLQKQNAISKADLDAAESREMIARAELRSAEFAQRVATYEMDQAEVALRYTVPPVDGEATDRLDEDTFRLMSPIDGKVLQVYNEDSVVVTPGMRLLQLGDTKDMEIKVDVLSSDAVQIRPGNAVRIEHWGGEKTLDGTVRLVEPAAFEKISALGVEERRVNVIVDFTSPWKDRETLGDGFRIEAAIVVDETEPISLKIADGTIFREAGQHYVFVVREGRAVKTPIAIGKSNGLETEVLDGLTENDWIIEHPSDIIVDNTRVFEPQDH
ncbi:efflux RND transporter periplasmic adaptor subunit [Stieleria varia]|uniref:Macrolide export protein MacA n=1 Tax=Stieleria varia TaxID=2528005 RepID=A0A5C5ZWF5_9BACT|nr:HlyD family efflux transporter periplasmic adaptor subunit [Stieleria varia]TWT91490.1 Macrolide export protein MacA [Stieleria varia]